MEALHARYPFLTSAREAVESADVDLATVISEGGPIVERAVDRVRSAIEDGTVGPPHRSERVELLSYPVARVLVSLVDEPGLVDHYARAEATTAFERFNADADGARLRSVASETLDLADLLREFDLAGDVEYVDDGAEGLFDVSVTAYLSLTEGLDADTWHLPRRSLADGTVPVTRAELDDLLREAIRERIAAGLPLSVPEAVTDELAPEVETVKQRLADVERSWDVDTVDPDSFPPCIAALLERVDAGGSFPAHSRFALVSFLATAGMSTDEIVDVVAEHPSVSTDEIAAQATHLREDEGPATYPPPSCATMQAYGDCVNQDALCAQISHPMSYYERRLRGDDPADYAERVDSQ